MSITPSDVAITAGLGTAINTVDVTNGGTTDKRQIIGVGGPNTTDLSVIASVQTSMPTGTEQGLVVRNASTADVTVAVSVTTATPGAGNTAQIALSGRKSSAVVITGTWTGTLVFEVSIDGSAWVGCDVYSELNESWAQSTTVNGSWWFEPLGVVSAVRVRASAWSSGTATGTLLAGMGDMNTQEFVGGPASGLPPNAALIGGSDGTLMRAIVTDTVGVLSTHVLPSSSTTFAATGVDSTALEASHVIKASAGILYGISGYNSKTAAQFILVFNSATVPADTTVPIIIISVPAQSNFSWDCGLFGKSFATGIAVSNSSTFSTKTIGSADCWFNALIA